MTYTLDVNPLVYAVDEESPFFVRARALIAQVFEGEEIVYIFWPVVLGFLRLSTHPGVLRFPLSGETAMEAVARLLSLPHVRTGGEREGFLQELAEATRGMSVRGKLFPDAHLVALMRQHGVTSIWTRDRDFRKFDGIRVVDPFD